MGRYSIFEYKEFPSMFIKGKTTEFSVILSEDGTLEYKKEISNRDILEFKYYDISNDSMKKIKDIIDNNKEIFAVNSRLDNGSLDGSGHNFLFANEKQNREITAWNIDESIDDGHKIRKEYLEEYGYNLKQERIVLKVFFEICKILKNDEIYLDLFHFNTNRKGMYEE